MNVSFTHHILIIHMHMHISDNFLIVAESHEILVLPPNLIILIQITYQRWLAGSLDSRGGSDRIFPVQHVGPATLYEKASLCLIAWILEVTHTVHFCTARRSTA